MKEIYVYENWKSDIPSLIGKMYAEGGRGKQVISFEYDEKWLEDLSNSISLDPDIGQFRGRQYTPADKVMFGAFADSYPDRWGEASYEKTGSYMCKERGAKT